MAALLAFAAAPAPLVRAADAPKIAIELNKLEPTEKACRIYFMASNPTDASYAALKLDLVVFHPDGVIAKRVAVDVAPLKPQKRSLKLFDLEGLPCDRIGSVLVNEAIDCRTDAGPVADCLGSVSLSSLSPVKLTK